MMTSHERPRLREDLVAEAIEDQGARFIDVIDPDTGSAYRFYDVEYSLACAMDGERDIPGLVRWAQEELGLAPSPAELRTVISTLGDLGYLSTGARDALVTPVGMPAVEPPATGGEVELGRFQAPVAAPAPMSAVEVELGAPGPGTAAPAPAAADVELGPSGPQAEDLPIPDPSRVPTRPSVSRASRPNLTQRGSEPALGARRSEPQLAERRSAPLVDSLPRRSSEQRMEPSPEPRRSSEQALRANALGPVAPQVSDPSLNLSLPIRPDDVKEAVRASREMRSVDVPADLMQALEAAERAPEPRRRAPSSVPPPMVPAVPPLSAAVPAVPSVATTPSATLAAVKPSPAVLEPISPLAGASVSVSDPIVSPSVPPLVPAPREVRAEPSRPLEQRPALVPVPRETPTPTPAAAAAVPTPAPARRSNGMFIAVLVLAILAVVAVIVWKFVLHQPEARMDGPASRPPVTATDPATAKDPATAPAAPVAAPEPPTAVLNLVKPSAVTVKMPAAGALQSVVADGTVVKEGDSVATLAGAKPVEQKIVQIRGDLDKRYPEDVARIKAKMEKSAGNREAMAQLTAELSRRNARIEQRTAELKAAEEALAKFSVSAAIAGTVTGMAKAGARLAADAEVASIEPAAYLRGTTDLKAATKLVPGDSIELNVWKDKVVGVAITCVVKIVQETRIEFHCPVSDGLSDGTELIYQPKK